MNITRIQGTAGLQITAQAARPGVTWAPRIGFPTKVADIAVPAGAKAYEATIYVAPGGAALIDLLDNSVVSQSGTAESAANNIAFSTQPASGESFTINRVTFTFIDSTPTNDTQIEIQGTLALTLAEAEAVVVAKAVAAISPDSSATDLYFYAIDPGFGGNLIPISISGASMSLTGTTLSGGYPDTVNEGVDGKDFEGIAAVAKTKLVALSIQRIYDGLPTGSTADEGIIEFRSAGALLGSADDLDYLSIGMRAGGASLLMNAALVTRLGFQHMDGAFGVKYQVTWAVE